MLYDSAQKDPADLSFCPHGIIQEILIGQTDAVRQLRFVDPAESRGLGHVQKLSGRAVGLGGVPLDFASIAHNLGDQLGQLLDGQFFAGTGIDRLVA